MCGIFGYFSPRGRDLDAERIRAMAAGVAHRGPDDQGVHQEPGVVLGNTRLAIVDLDHGHQPFCSDDGAIVVVQNGEIYNHLELAAELRAKGRVFTTACDTEVILRLYEHEGIEGLSRLNGMFAIAIWDRRAGALHLVRDRLGVKPLHYAWHEGDLYFASEIKSLLWAGIPRALDREALHQLLTFNYVPVPLTLFAGIRHLEPGHRLRVDAHGVEAKPWWSLAHHVASAGVTSCDQGEAVRTILDILDDATRIRLRADVAFGAFLSGGIDSSAVLGMMERHLGPGVRTFSIGFADPRFDESPYVRQAAERFAAEPTIEVVDPDMIAGWPRAIFHQDQPHGDVSFLPTLRVAELARRSAKMVLTGDGADELFAGYLKYAEHFSGGAAASVGLDPSYLKAIGLFGQDREALYGPAMRGQVAEDASWRLFESVVAPVAGADAINQALYFDTVQLLPGNNLVKPDRMTMAVGLEARSPFLDYRMAEHAFSLPGAWKLQGRTTKYLLKQAVEPLIGTELTHRRKQMFTVPIGEWFKGRLAPFCREVLGERFRARGLIAGSAVDRLLAEHQGRACDHTREIRVLIALELWHRIFIDADWRRPPSLAELGVAECG